MTGDPHQNARAIELALDRLAEIADQSERSRDTRVFWEETQQVNRLFMYRKLLHPDRVPLFVRHEELCDRMRDGSHVFHLSKDTLFPILDKIGEVRVRRASTAFRDGDRSWTGCFLPRRMDRQG